MFKLQFYRCEAPRPHEGQSFRSEGAFAFTGASSEQQALWESIYRWLHPPASSAAGGGAPHALEEIDATALARRIASPECPDIKRLGSAYILGRAAAGPGEAGEVALSALLALFEHPWNVAARCAHFGIAAAGQAAIEPLCGLLERTTATLAARGAEEDIGVVWEHQPEPSDTLALVSHALGESVRVITPRVIDVMCDALATSLVHLNVQVHRITGGATKVAGPVRTGINGGRSDGNGADRSISLAVRAAASAVHALGMAAERVISSARDGDPAAEAHAAQIMQALLPVSLTLDPALSIPGARLSHDNSRFWLAEGAAYGILRLCSGSPGTSSLQVVTSTCPAHHSDQRYAPALCLGALDRLRQAVSANTAPIPRLLTWLEEAEAQRGWERMAAEASADNPEPWLAAGVSGVAWV